LHGSAAALQQPAACHLRPGTLPDPQVSFTRSLSQSLVSRGIRVNAVAPGPIHTPLIPATFDSERAWAAS